MHIDLTPEQQRLRDELDTYFDDICTPEFRAEQKAGWMEGGGPLYWQALAKMSADGWLGIGWPTEYGGQGRTPIEQMLFADACMTHNFPFPFLTMSTVGPTLMKYGSDAQRNEYLPRMIAGEVNFCIGYTEPSAGTDLASLSTRAVLDGDEWVINGQKVYTSLANFAQYCWLAARTDPDVPKHAGLSMFIVPMDDPGITITPIHTVGGVRTNAVYFDNVRIPKDNLVGKLNGGWGLIVSQLNHERVNLTPSGPSLRLIEDVRRWAAETKLPDGRRVIDQPWVQLNLAKARAHGEVCKLMNWKQAWQLTHATLNMDEASAIKVFTSEYALDCYGLLLEILGPVGLVQADAPGAVLRGEIESRYCNSLILTFGGGTNEVQRDIVAMAGLGMPHYK